MKRTYILIALFTLLYFSPSKAQLRPILIQGKIDSAILARFNNHEMLIKIYDPVKKLLREEKVIKVNISIDRSFSVTIIPNDSLTYVCLRMKNKNPNAPKLILEEEYPIQYPLRFVSGLDELYLFESGDSVHVKVDKEKLSFKGRGAEKLNCQFKVYNLLNLSKLFDARRSELFNLKDYGRNYTLLHQSVDADIAVRTALLESYKGKFSKEIYDRIYVDAITLAERRLVYFGPATGDPNETQELKLHLKTFIRKNHFNGISPAILSKSAYFPEMLMYKEYRSLQFLSPGYNNLEACKKLLALINTKYGGRLKDLLIINIFQEISPESVKSNFAALSGSVSKGNVHEALNTWLNRQQTAFPFELEDTSGKIHKLSDYKGKVLVIDLWFTGCGACEQLNKAMHPIIDRFEQNKNIVFLSLNTDRKKATWLKSISSGAYTSPKNINLNTNGFGFQHPMIKHYNFQSAPQQLIIGKEGNLITASPPRPDGGYTKSDETNSKAFIEMLENALKKNDGF